MEIERVGGCRNAECSWFRGFSSITHLPWPVDIFVLVGYNWEAVNKWGKVTWNFRLETLNLTKQAVKNFFYVKLPGTQISNQGKTTDFLHLTRRERAKIPQRTAGSSWVIIFLCITFCAVCLCFVCKTWTPVAAEPWPPATATARVPLASALG